MRLLSQFCPFSEYHFLAGYDNGAICLFHLHSAEPVRRWETAVTAAGARRPVAADASRIAHVVWSPHRASVFFAMNAARTMMAFDLLAANEQVCCESASWRVSSIAPFH